jgi:hypothetical protein
LSSRIQRTLALSACDYSFIVQCDEDGIADSVFAVFGGLRSVAQEHVNDAAAKYHVHHDSAGFRVRAPDGAEAVLQTEDDVLFHIDKHLTIALQLQRPDLFFVHAAVVSGRGSAAVIAAPPGTGKSTLTLALARSGFTYLSDELAPIEVVMRSVLPFRRALCLKAIPPHPLSLPRPTVRTGPRYHIPASALGPVDAAAVHPIGVFIFAERHSTRGPVSHRISPAEAVARLIANALNPAAHRHDGLDAAAALCHCIPAFSLNVYDLGMACAEVERICTAQALEDRDGLDTAFPRQPSASLEPRRPIRGLVAGHSAIEDDPAAL